MTVSIPDDNDFVSSFLALTERAQAAFEAFVRIIEDRENPYCYQIQKDCKPRDNEEMEYPLGDGSCIIWKVISCPVRNRHFEFEWTPAVLEIIRCHAS